MSGAFDVSTTSTSISLDDDRRGEFAVTVHNRSGSPQRGTLTTWPEIRIDGAKAAKPEWFTIAEAERDFPVHGTHQYTVRVEVPSGIEAGTYGFHPFVRAETNPDENSTLGPALTFVVQKREDGGKPPPFPWWIVAVIAGLVLVVAGVVAFLLLRDAPVPSVVGRPVSEAESVLTEAGFTVGTSTEQSTLNAADGTVLDQDPKAENRAPRGSAVNLVVERNIVVPNVVGQSFAAAQNTLANAGLTVGIRTDRSTLSVANGIVLEQSPRGQQLAAPNGAVNLIVERNVVVPNVVRSDVEKARAILTQAELRVGRVSTRLSTQPSGTVLSQSPGPRTRVAPDTAVDLVIAFERDIIDCPRFPCP